MASQGPQPSLSSFPTKAHRAHSVLPAHTLPSLLLHSTIQPHRAASASFSMPCSLWPQAFACASTWLTLYLTTLHVRCHFLTITSPGKREVHPKVPQRLTLPCCTLTKLALACSGLFPPDCEAHRASLCLSQQPAQCLAPRRHLR